MLKKKFKTATRLLPKNGTLPDIPISIFSAGKSCLHYILHFVHKQQPHEGPFPNAWDYYGIKATLTRPGHRPGTASALLRITPAWKMGFSPVQQGPCLVNRNPSGPDQPLPGPGENSYSETGEKIENKNPSGKWRIL
jgi:hypothetical protein